MLRVGLAEVDITPEPGLHMSGMGEAPKAEGVNWPLLARILLFDDGVARAAIVSLDLLWLTYPTVLEYRRALAPVLGLDLGSIMLACSHTHRGPFTSALFADFEADFDYLDLLRNRLLNAARDAASGLAPGEAEGGARPGPGLDLEPSPHLQGWPCGYARAALRARLPGHGGTGGQQGDRPFGTGRKRWRYLGGLVNFACHTTVMGSVSEYFWPISPGP